MKCTGRDKAVGEAGCVEAGEGFGGVEVGTEDG